MTATLNDRRADLAERRTAWEAKLAERAWADAEIAWLQGVADEWSRKLGISPPVLELAGRRPRGVRPDAVAWCARDGRTVSFLRSTIVAGRYQRTGSRIRLREVLAHELAHAVEYAWASSGVVVHRVDLPGFPVDRDHGPLFVAACWRTGRLVREVAPRSWGACVTWPRGQALRRAENEAKRRAANREAIARWRERAEAARLTRITEEELELVETAAAAGEVDVVDQILANVGRPKPKPDPPKRWVPPPREGLLAMAPPITVEPVAVDPDPEPPPPPPADWVARPRAGGRPRVDTFARKRKAERLASELETKFAGLYARAAKATVARLRDAAATIGSRRGQEAVVAAPGDDERLWVSDPAAVFITDEEWAALVAELVGDGIEAVVTDAAERVAVGYGFDVSATHLGSAVLEHVQFIESWSPDLRLDVANVVQTGVDQGWSINRIADAIRKGTEAPLSEQRARTIARTEAISSQNAGTYAAEFDLANIGVLAGREWKAAMDGRTRPEHAEAHGQRRLFGEDFVVGGYHCRYPGDPNLPVHLRVNERCATVSYEPETPPPARSTRVEPVG